MRALLIVGFVSILLSACVSNPDPVSAHAIFNIEVIQEVPADHKVPMVFQVLSADTFQAYPGSIERRGGYSISFPKPSYEIDLERDIALAKLPADDDWILNANYIDKTFLRHVLSYDLFREMSPVNEAPQCKYVELRLNGRYQGLYVLMEKLDKSSLGINNRDPEACVFKEPPIFIPDLTSFRPQYGDNYYQQTYPEKRADDRTNFIYELRTFVAESSDSLFAAQIGSRFDLNNIIDWHLLLLLSNNSDGLKKNFYLYQQSADTPLRVAPWDYDHSYGRDGDNEKNMDRWIDCRRSLLFARLLEQPFYWRALKARWQTLNETGLLSLNSLLARVDSYLPKLEPLVQPNFVRWSLDGPVYYDGNDFAAEIALMKTYMHKRHGMLVEYFAGEHPPKGQ